MPTDTMTNHTSVPHSPSWSSAAATSRAASSLVGGLGCGRRARGFTTWSSGLTVIQPYRTAMPMVPLRMACSVRIVVDASGRH